METNLLNVQMQTDYRGIFVQSEAQTSVVAVPYAVEPEVYLTDTFRVGYNCDIHSFRIFL